MKTRPPSNATIGGDGRDAAPSRAKKTDRKIGKVVAAEDPGVFDIDASTAVDLLEPRSEKSHSHIRGSLPANAAIETSYISGPVFVVRTDNSVVDTTAGVTILNGDMLGATAVTKSLVARYGTPDFGELKGALRLDHLFMPLASQRMANFCRWWLDSVAKAYVCSLSDLSGQGADILLPPLQPGFQAATLQLFAETSLLSNAAPAPSRFVKGTSVNTPGIAFGGGQRIGGATVRGFSEALRSLPLPKSQSAQGFKAIYTSRSDSRLRSVVNEDEILPKLRDLGFEVVIPGKLPLADQIRLFRDARLIVSPHGAGLTNILHCQPGTTLVEIFPEGGVHGSAFLRMSSNLEMSYYFVVAERVGDPPKGNPNNSDLRLDIDNTIAFLRDVLRDSDVA